MTFLPSRFFTFAYSRSSPRRLSPRPFMCKLSKPARPVILFFRPISIAILTQFNIHPTRTLLVSRFNDDHVDHSSQFRSIAFLVWPGPLFVVFLTLSQSALFHHSPACDDDQLNTVHLAHFFIFFPFFAFACSASFCFFRARFALLPVIHLRCRLPSTTKPLLSLVDRLTLHLFFSFLLFLLLFRRMGPSKSCTSFRPAATLAV